MVQLSEIRVVCSNCGGLNSIHATDLPQNMSMNCSYCGRGMGCVSDLVDASLPVACRPGDAAPVIGRL